MANNGGNESFPDRVQAEADARREGATERDPDLNDVTAKSEAGNRSGFLGGIRAIFGGSNEGGGGHGASSGSSPGDKGWGDPGSGGTGYMD